MSLTVASVFESLLKHRAVHAAALSLAAGLPDFDSALKSRTALGIPAASQLPEGLATRHLTSLSLELS